MKKYLVYSFIIALIGLSTIYIVVKAASSTFTSTLSVQADDYTPPTIPTGLVATTFSSSQINLIWNASTDDVAVAGYRIFRDGDIIASTTSLFYQDTALSASTNYIYTVEAFDSVPRYSGQSSTVNATTSDAPVVSPSPSTSPAVTGGSSSNPGSQILTIYNLALSPALTSEIISFETSQAAHAKVFWGITPDYELGAISGFFYELKHSVNISDLNPFTKYFYKIEVTNSNGVIKTYESTFQTRKAYEESFLTNVLNFKAIPQEKSIALNWDNPLNETFDSVRLIRSDKFFPRDINDGEILYEGNKESFIDRNVTIGTTYYYSIFTKSKTGEYSSGALAQARIKPEGEIELTPVSKDPFINIDVLRNVDPSITALSLFDFDFIQDGRKLVSLDNNVIIDGTKNLTISLSYGKIAEVLKTIAFTLIDPEDSTKVFPFLLRVNKDKTAYEATLAPLGRSGKYEMKIIVLDYKNQGLKRLEGSLQAFVLQAAKDFIKSNDDYKKAYIIFAIIFLIFLIAYIIDIHRNEKK